jgi:hypothetical protein
MFQPPKSHLQGAQLIYSNSKVNKNKSTRCKIQLCVCVLWYLCMDMDKMKFTCAFNSYYCSHVIFVITLSWIIGWLLNYDLEMCGRKRSCLINTYSTVPRLCDNCAVLLKVQIVSFPFELCSETIFDSHTYRTVILSCVKRVIMDFFESDFSRPQHNTCGTQFCMCKLKYSILSVACGWPVGHPSLPALFWLLLATIQTFMEVVCRMLSGQK